MATYVISSCFLENIDSKIYYTEILLAFTQQNSLKVGIDFDGIILKIYEEIASQNPGIAYWLWFMSIKPSSFEYITHIKDSSLKSPEIFLYLCKFVVNDKKIIAFSHQTYKDFNYVSESEINYQDVIIKVFDKDEALEELKNYTNKTIQINNSIVAMNHSTVKGAKNEQN